MTASEKSEPKNISPIMKLDIVRSVICSMIQHEGSACFESGPIGAIDANKLKPVVIQRAKNAAKQIMEIELD